MLSKNIFRKLPIIETSLFTLRKLTVNDSADIFAYASKPEMTKYTLWQTHISHDDTKAFLAVMEGKYEAGEPASWGIVLKETDRVIGTCGFEAYSEVDDCAAIGYVIAPEYWGKGLMSKVVAEVIHFGFEVIGLNRIEATCDVDNIGSAKVMEKNGMKFEGILREYRKIRGVYRDTKYYSILKREYMKTNITKKETI